jgi:hypothetical protein
MSGNARELRKEFRRQYDIYFDGLNVRQAIDLYRSNNNGRSMFSRDIWLALGARYPDEKESRAEAALERAKLRYDIATLTVGMAYADEINRVAFSLLYRTGTKDIRRAIDTARRRVLRDKATERLQEAGGK